MACPFKEVTSGHEVHLHLYTGVITLANLYTLLPSTETGSYIVQYIIPP